MGFTSDQRRERATGSLDRALGISAGVLMTGMAFLVADFANDAQVCVRSWLLHVYVFSFFYFRERSRRLGGTSAVPRSVGTCLVGGGCRELEHDVLAGQVFVHAGEGVQLVLERGLVLAVQEPVSEQGRIRGER